MFQARSLDPFILIALLAVPGVGHSPHFKMQRLKHGGISGLHKSPTIEVGELIFSPQIHSFIHHALPMALDTGSRYAGKLCRAGRAGALS